MSDLNILTLSADGEGQTTFNLGDSVLTFTTRFNYQAGAWSVDITDANDALMAAGVMLVPGVDILKPYPDLRESVGSIVVFELNPGDYSNPDALGENVQLVWYPVGDEVVLS